MAERPPALQRVPARAGVLPVALGALVVGLLVGAGIGAQTAPRGAGRQAGPSPTDTGLATPLDDRALLPPAAVAPELLQAY